MSSSHSFWYRYRYFWLVLVILLLALWLLFGFASPATGTKQFTLLDSGLRLVQETRALTVGEALQELDIKLAYADESVPAAGELLTSGTEVKLRRSLPVVVRGPSGQARIFTKAATVAEFLRDINYQLSEKWQVRPASEKVVTRDLVIELLRVEQEEQEVVRTLVFSRRYKSNKELPYGQERRLQEGENGTRVDRYRVRYENGKEVGRELLASQVTVPRQDLIIEQGVKVAAGQSLGIVKASYYADFFHGRRTSSGETFYNDRLTAAHRKLPFGTIVKVTNPVNGQAIIVPINDRGPYVAGREIDLSRAAFAAISPLSRGVIPVELEIVSTGEIAQR